MKRTFKTFTLAVLIGCCVFYGNPPLADSLDIAAVIPDPPVAENVPHMNAVQHPFLLKPVKPEGVPDDSMVRSPVREEQPFQHPFLVEPHDSPEKRDAVFVDVDSSYEASDALEPNG